MLILYIFNPVCLACFRGVACWNSIHFSAHSVIFKLVILPSLIFCSGYVLKQTEFKNEKMLVSSTSLYAF